MKSAIRLLAALVLVLSAGRTEAQSVTIYRDAYGTPSVVADRLPDAMYGLGYAMAQDNAEQMARNFKQARGRRAEVDGQAHLITDSFLRSLGIEERAIKAAGTLPAEARTCVQRFCDGANRAVAEQKGRIPGWIEPFTPVDVISLAQLAQAAFPLQEISNRLLPGIGSNQFAIAPKRTANGRAILSIDPHLNWSGPLLWYEYAVYCRTFNFHGITLSGLPFGSMGHTDHVAWSMTNNNPRLYDFVTVKTNPANPNQYSYHGVWRDFEQVPLELRFREGAALKTLKQTARRTAWGPLAPLSPQAVRLAIPNLGAMFRQSLRMARARTAAEFRAALQDHGLSMWNIVYADTRGHIGYQYNANVPRRDETLDWSKAVPGDDPRTKWGDPWPLDALPHAEDPASGLLINCNTAPWLTTLGGEIKSTAWPEYVTSYGSTTRYERLKELLTGDDRVTLDKAKSYATDTLVPYARSLINRLIEQEKLRRFFGSITGPTGVHRYEKAPEEIDAERLHAQALEVLRHWDCRADVGSKGCALYLYWMRADRRMPAIARKTERGEAWTTEEAAAFDSALDKAAAYLLPHGPLDEPWGEVHVSVRGEHTAPVSGLGYFAPGDATATVTPNFGPFANGRIVCAGGSSFRMIVDLDPKGVRSWSVLPY
ncbi:MAG TPA: penicillin acylase family protein, partial [Chthonomonadaceae bacterium]|nr:penicillin acylase family protein [Chthonomonadaceae bacterium]